MTRSSLCAAAAFVLVAPMSLALGADYDEAVSGDISDDQFAPLSLGLLSPGSNIVDGSTTANPLDRDFFSFEVPAGLTLDAIILTEYVSEQNVSFLALEDAPVFDTLISSADYLGTATVGNPGFGSAQGDDLLDNLGASAIFGGQGFVGSLGPGVYTLWFQETAGPVDYAFDLQISPAPGAAALLGMAGLVGLRRRRA